MPSIVIGNMHQEVFSSFLRLFKHIGFDVYCPKEGHNFYGYGRGFKGPRDEGLIEVTEEECLDARPDIVLCSCWEQLPMATDLSRKMRRPLVVRAGNNRVPYNKSHSDYLISSDIQTYNESNIPKKLFLYMPLDYDEFKPVEHYRKSSMICPTFINHYAKFWRTSYSIYDSIRRAPQNANVAFIHFGATTEEQPYSPYLCRPSDVRYMLYGSRAALHIKELEGYGWTLLEAIASGIPIISVRPFVAGKTCETFLKENETCLFIEGQAPVKEFNKLFFDVDALNRIALKGPSFIRDFISVEKEGAKLSEFLEQVL
jgi:hypothetical protein